MRYLAVLIALTAIVALSALPYSAVQRETVAVASDLPLVDFHEHLLGRMSADELIRVMNESGISRMVLMPNGLGGHSSREPSGRGRGGRGGGDAPDVATDEQARMYSERYPGRFIPFVSLMVRAIREERERWLHPDRPTLDFVRQVEAKLATGTFYGMGELIARHYGYTNPDGGTLPDFDNPVDSPLVHKLVDLAERYHVVMDIHAEGEAAVVDAMGRVLAAHPAATIVWAHNCGRSSASKIRELLQRYPNLLCDLGAMAGTFGYVNGETCPHCTRAEPWSTPIEDGQGHLVSEMKEVFEAFADRFVGIGMDAVHYEQWRRYANHVGRFRRLLSQLSPSAAEKIAHENAERLFHLPPLRP